MIRIFSAGVRTVHSLTPKRLRCVAADRARPVRAHTYTGQVWASRHGSGRWLLKTLDGVIARLNTHLLADSVSQRDFLRSEGVLGRTQGEVLHHGSVSGVDSARFKPDAAARTEVRSELSAFRRRRRFSVRWRLTRDTRRPRARFGIQAAAARGCRSRFILIFVGPDEEKLAAEIERRCPSSAVRLRFVGWTDRPERYMAGADVFCLPSYREGFGTVIVEAAAAGLPAIGSRIYGVVDAIEDEQTGLLVDRGDVAALAAAMHRLAEDSVMRAALAEAARTRALRDFRISARAVSSLSTKAPCRSIAAGRVSRGRID